MGILFHYSKIAYRHVIMLQPNFENNFSCCISADFPINIQQWNRSRQDILMTRINLIFFIILFMIAESRGQRQDLITVDIRKNYSLKKELFLQDFMDVEYVVLETNDDFFNQGVVMDIGKEAILV